jgi:hypothetical protein
MKVITTFAFLLDTFSLGCVVTNSTFTVSRQICIRERKSPIVNMLILLVKRAFEFSEDAIAKKIFYW